MANKTIYGCVTGGSAITFDKEPCFANNVTGCIEMSDVDHLYMVKVVISEDLSTCNDTYYGCVNWSTGKFQLEIPDDCCYTSNDCSYCTTDETPQKVSVAFSGINLCGCPGDYLSSISFITSPNNTFTLSHCGSELPCFWSVAVPDSATRTKYDDYGCSGNIVETKTWSYIITLRKSVDEITIAILWGSNLCSWGVSAIFYAIGEPTSGCVNGTYSNSYTGGCDESPLKYGKGGSVTISEVGEAD